MQVEELCMRGEKSLNSAEWVEPILPPLWWHPWEQTSVGLKDLWKDQESREFNFDFEVYLADLESDNQKLKEHHDLRWRLFSWIINPELDNLALILKENSLDEKAGINISFFKILTRVKYF